MNFFKSVFSDDPDPPGSESEPDSPSKREEQENPDQNTSPEQSNADADGGAWSFGGLMKTLATRSESVIETYRRDLQEFSSGLKKEIEVAQGSLGTVGHAIDEFGNSVLKGTAQIIAQGKEAILAVDNESDSSDNNSSKSYGGRDGFSSRPYSRFEAQVRAVQGDVNTYCEESEDLDDYKEWKLGFDLDKKSEELGKLLEENVDMRGIYNRVVPNMVDQETFWFRYFYKVHKLKQAENVRAKLVRRAISQEDEEELTWDIDDDDDDDNSKKGAEASKEVSKMKLEETEMGGKDIEQKAQDEVGTSDSKTEVRNVELKKRETPEEKRQVDDKEIPESKSVARDASEAKAPSGDLSKPSGVVVTSSQHSVQEEEDLGWDEIEDLSSIEEKEVSRSGVNLNRAELHKRLSTAEEEDEDLSWDIEDDDEPIKG